MSQHFGEVAPLTSPKTIRDKIIDVLKAAEPKNEAEKTVTHWFSAEPPKNRWPGFPFGWVEAALGPQQPPVGSKAEITDNFYVVIVDKHVDSETAEASVLDFVESLEAVLDDDATLAGLVGTSYVVNREKQKVFDQDYSVVAARLTLYTRRRE